MKFPEFTRPSKQLFTDSYKEKTRRQGRSDGGIYIPPKSVQVKNDVKTAIGHEYMY